MKKVIIIGANSFIARNFIQNLLNNYSNEAKLELFDYQLIQVDGFANYHQLNILKKENALKLPLDCDLLYLFSGKTGTLDGFSNYSEFIDINEKGLLNILNACKEKGFKGKIIFPSSRLVYKGSEKDLSEDDSKELKTIYAVNKFACEQYLKIYKDMFGINYCIFRICVPYGSIIEANPSYGTVGFMLKQAKEKRCISIYGDGSVKRTFTHMFDLCSILWLAGSDNRCVNDVYNIGGETRSLLEVAKIISKKYDSGITFTPYSDNQFSIETGSTTFSFRKLNKIIKYHYKYSLDGWAIEQ